MVLLIINSLNTTYGRSFQSTTIQHNNKNDKLLLGPINNNFVTVLVKSLHDNFKNDVTHICEGDSGCINIKIISHLRTQRRQAIKVNIFRVAKAVLSSGG